ncbi:MAG TPA: EpsI family protein [Gemmatimonas sp.]|uniref:exosortase C-terminal domain/associated protein EpsI n=1 Tax=Gemmatimonas sp. TaxID=1962908 RepID=UPI002EDA5F45
MSRVLPEMLSAALAFALFLGLSPSWLWFPSVWASNREHGFAIAALCGWLLWRERRQLQGWSPERLLWPLLGIASIAWWAAFTADIQVVHLLLTPVILWLWLGATAGQRALRATAPAALTFLLAIPVWEALVPLLQTMTVLFCRAVLSMTSIQFTIRDNSIMLPFGVLEVADSCSGLNFVMVGTTVGAAYAHLFVSERRWQWRIVASATALSILANWIRVLGLVVIAHRTRMQSSLMQDHEMYGWTIFLVALLTFFMVARRLEQRMEHPLTMAAPAPDTAGMGQPPLASIMPVTAIAVLGPALVAVLAVLPAAETPAVGVDVANGRSIGIAPGSQWTVSIDSAPTAFEPHFAGSSRVSRQFVDNGMTVQVDQFHYAQQKHGAEATSYENHIAPDSMIVQRRTVGPLDNSLRIVQQTAIREASDVRIVWSWYRIGGIETPSSTKAKLLQILAAIRRRRDADVVLVSARCKGAECDAATSALYSLVTGRELPAKNAGPASGL